MIFPEKLYKAYCMCSDLGWDEDSRRGKLWWNKYVKEANEHLKKKKIEIDALSRGSLVVQLRRQRNEQEKTYF